MHMYILNISYRYYIFMYIYIYVCIYIYVYIYIYTCMHTCAYPANIHIYTYIHTYVLVYTKLPFSISLTHNHPHRHTCAGKQTQKKPNNTHSSIPIYRHANRQPQTRHRPKYARARTHTDTHNSHASPMVSILVRFRCVTHLSKSENKLLIVSAKSVLQYYIHICIDTTCK